MACHPEAGEARRGTSQLQIALPRNIGRPLTVNAALYAEAVERLRGPSPSARLGMTTR